MERASPTALHANRSDKPVTEVSVNQELEAKARGLASLKGYTTNLTAVSAEFVIDAYHQPWRIVKASPDVQASSPGPTRLTPQTANPSRPI